MRTITLLGLLLLAGCGDPASIPPDTSPTTAPLQQTSSQAFNTWLDQQFEQELDFSPQWRTQLGDKTDYDKLDQASEAAIDEQLDWRRQSVATMRQQFDYEALDAEAKTSWDLWVYTLESAERARPFIRHDYLLGRGGPQVWLPNFMINFHRVDTMQDMEAYITRLQQMDDVLMQYLERAQLAAGQGLRQPRFNYRFAMEEIDRMLDGAPFRDAGDSPLWLDANSKLDQLVNQGLLAAEQRDGLLAEVRTALVDQLQPAYQSIRDWLAEDLMHADEPAKGVWALPDGAAYYRELLAQMTTLDLDSGEIHQLGLDEVARIQDEMQAVKQQVGFEGPLPDFFDFLRTNERFILPDTDAGRATYIEMAQQHMVDMQAALPDWFGRLPEAPLEVRRVEAFREQPGGAQHYMRGAPDGSRPGVFYVHLSDMSAMPTYPLESIAYHEGLPGHHLQISIAQETEGLPRFRTQYGYTAYSEGWGLYAESLASEMGFYTDPYSDFGRLGSEIWRAARLVVDTGIHAMGWTQEQAVQYFLENTPVAEGAVRSEVERYFIMPGQATAYKTGSLKIQQLRQQAQAELGDRFNIRGFHDTVLDGGSLPLPVLEARISRWIESRKSL